MGTAVPRLPARRSPGCCCATSTPASQRSSVRIAPRVDSHGTIGEDNSPDRRQRITSWAW
ncbi:MAG: hypothetical protein FWJ87_02380 [Micromonosporaceae bacterium]